MGIVHIHAHKLPFRKFQESSWSLKVLTVSPILVHRQLYQHIRISTLLKICKNIIWITSRDMTIGRKIIQGQGIKQNNMQMIRGPGVSGACLQKSQKPPCKILWWSKNVTRKYWLAVYFKKKIQITKIIWN